MRIADLHSGWTLRQCDSNSMPWLPATVPGHLHPDLVAGGVIPDPFHRLNEIGVQWVDEVDWEYKTAFAAPVAEEGERQILSFEGLDSVGTIFLNGEEAARFESMHIPVEIDVTGRLKEENELRIVFRSPREAGREKKREYFEEQGLAPDTACFEERAFMRKAQYMYGWDWGPMLASVGVWKPARIITFKGRIQWTWPRQTHRDDGSVMLHLEAGKEGDGSLRYKLTSPSGQEWQAEDPDSQILINEPMLWWPNNQGPQPLYTLVTELVHDGAVLDSRTQKVGLRTIQVVERPDDKGASFEFEVNGKPLFMSGSNWIPDHSFPSLPTRERIFTQVQLAKTMNQNMLRVWGGGVFESDDFYDACDEMGILVWQDFPYGCSYVPDTEPWRILAVKEAEANVTRLRGRTSLAIWCGNNENETMWNSKWGGPDRSPSRYHGEVIYEETLPDALKTLDPDRPYIPSSPTGTKGNANGDDRGDVHNWSVWHGQGTWRNYHESDARFCSEFGFASSCGHKAWDMCLSDVDKTPRSPAVAWHDKTRKGYETFLAYIEDEYPKIETLDDLVYYGQLNQRDAMRFALQHYRTSPWCRGALIWQHNDCWPVQSWALVDYAQVVKAAGEEMARCFDKILVSVQALADEVELWISNDGLEVFSGDVKATVFSTETGDAKGAWSFSNQVLEANERRKLKTWSKAEFGGESLLMEAVYGSAKPCIALLQKPKDTKLGTPVIKARASGLGFDLTVSGAPAIDVMIRETENSPRFFTILPGRTVTVQGANLVGRAVRALSGEIVIGR